MPNITSDITDIYTLGYLTKNDGGGAHYKRYTAQQSGRPYVAFDDENTTIGHWGMVPDGGTINPLQAGAYGTGTVTVPVNDQPAIQACLDFIARWNTATTPTPVDSNGFFSDNRAIKLVIPANKRFQIVAAGGGGLQLKGPITIEGEDRDASRLWLFDSSGSAIDLIKVANKNRITLRNLTLEGSYDGTIGSDGKGQLLKFDTVDGVLLENVTFTRNRSVLVGGDWVRNLVMRGCLMSESRNGGLVINNVENITVVNNDFRWVPDDPVALTISDILATVPAKRNDGGAIQVIGNRMFGTRGININGAKNVIVADNIHTLGRGRAIHIGTTSFQQKGDTSTLNIIVRHNIITDLLDAQVDPRFDPNDERAGGGHRAIDTDMLQAV